MEPPQKGVHNEPPIVLERYRDQKGFYSPFNDTQTLEQIQDTLKYMQEKGTVGMEFEKRFQLLEYNISGIMERHLLIAGQTGQKDYYQVLQELNAKLVIEEARRNNLISENQLLKTKISNYEAQNNLPLLKLHEESIRVNEDYLNLFARITELMEARHEDSEIGRWIVEKLYPEVQFFQFKRGQILGHLEDSSWNRGEDAKAVQSELKHYFTELEAVLGDKAITVAQRRERIGQATRNFYISAHFGVEGYREIFNEREEISKLKTFQQSFFASMQYGINKIGDYQGIEELRSIFNGLKRQSNSQLFVFNGWIQSEFSSERVIEHVSDQVTKDHLIVLAKAFEKLIAKFPRVEKEIPDLIRTIINFDYVRDASESEIMNRLQKIIGKEEMIVKVENVFQYENQADRRKIFHLRVLIKALLEELTRIGQASGQRFELDQGLLAMINSEIIDGIDVEHIYQLFRPLPRTVQVPTIVERVVPVITHTREQVPVKIEKPLPIELKTEKEVFMTREVPVSISEPFEIVREIPVILNQTECHPVQVLEIREVVTEKVIEVLSNVDMIKTVPVTLYETKIQEIELIKQKMVVEEIPKQIPKYFPQKQPGQVIEVQRKVEVPVFVEVYQEVPKEIPIYTQIPLYVEKIKEIQTMVPFIKEVPHLIKEEKIVEVRTTHQEPVKVTCKHEVMVVKETKTTEIQCHDLEKVVFHEKEKELFIETCHFVKGDDIVNIKEVRVFEQVPLYQERLITKTDIFEKTSSNVLYEERVRAIQIQKPYFVDREKILHHETKYPVPVKYEVAKPVSTQVPYPIFIEHDRKTYIPKFIEKLCPTPVEIPLVVEVEKIVEKIVIVPRIVHVPFEQPIFIDRFIEIEKPVLHIIEIPKTEIVEVIREQFLDCNPIITEKEVPFIQYEVVKEEIIVECIKQVPKFIQIPPEKHYIHQEVIKQVPLELIREVIVESERICNVGIPVPQEVCVPFNKWEIAIQEKLVPVHETIVLPFEVQLEVEKIVPMYIIKQELVRVPETKIEIVREEVPKPIEVLVQVKVEVPKELKVPQVEYLTITKTVPTEMYLNQDVIVPIENLIYKEVQMPYVMRLPEACEIREQVICEIRKEEFIGVNLERTINVPYRADTIVEKTVIRERENLAIQTRQVEVRVDYTVNVPVPGVPEIVHITTQVPIVVQEIKTIEIPGAEKLKTDMCIVPSIQIEKVIDQKVIEKIRLLPTVHEVTKTVYKITQVESLGVECEKSQEDHRIHCIGIVELIHKGLEDILKEFGSLDARKRPSQLIGLIEKYLPEIDRWLRTPRIIQVTQEVEKDRDRAVLVPVNDREREVVLAEIIGSLLEALQKAPESARQNVPDNLKWLFQFQLNLKNLLVSPEFTQYFDGVREHFRDLKSWKQEHLVMLYSFLSNRFAFKQAVDQQSSYIEGDRKRLDDFEMLYEGLYRECQALWTERNQLLRTLRNHRCPNIEEIAEMLRKYEGKPDDGQFDYQGEGGSGGDGYGGQGPRSGSGGQGQGIGNTKYSMSGSRSRYQHNSLLNYEGMRLNTQMVTSEIHDSSDTRYETMLSRYTIIEREKIDLQKRVEELTSSIIGNQMQGENRNQVQEMRGIYESRLGSLQTDNRRLQEDFTKMQDQLKASRRATVGAGNAEEVKKDFEGKIRNIEQTHKKDIDRLNQEHRSAIAGSSKSSTDLERVRKQLTDDFDRRLREIEENHKRQLEKIKSEAQVSSRQSGSQRGQENKLSQENKLLGDKIKEMEMEIHGLQREVEVSHVSERGQYSESRITRKSEVYQSAQITGQSGSKKFERSALQQEIERTPQHRIEREEARSTTSSKEGSPAYSGNPTFKATMTLRVFMENAPTEDIITPVMLKVLDATQDQIGKGILNCYSPTNIYTKNFNLSNFQQMFIKFGAPILNKKNRRDGPYIAPEVHAGNEITSKAIVFTLGVIWDELLHGTPFFATIAEIESMQNHYTVRNAKISPIIKNLLVDMLVKEKAERSDLGDVRKRLSLQKYVSGTYPK